jgi:hypothetical protein
MRSIRGAFPRAVTLFCLSLCASLSGCDRASIMNRETPVEDESFARKHVELLRQQDFVEVEQDLDPSITDSDIRNKLVALAAVFPPEEPKSVKVVGIVFRRGGDIPVDTLTLEYGFPGKWILVDMSIHKTGEVPTIVGFHAVPIAEPLEEVNKFRLTGKSALHYTVLLIAITVPIFCLYVLVLCLRSRKENRKWLWAALILFCIGRFVINWTTGEWSFTPFAVYLLGSSVTANPAYGPWMLAVSFPLGAILFLRKEKQSTQSDEIRKPATGQQSIDSISSDTPPDDTEFEKSNSSPD